MKWRLQKSITQCTSVDVLRYRVCRPIRSAATRSVHQSFRVAGSDDFLSRTSDCRRWRHGVAVCYWWATGVAQRVAFNLRRLHLSRSTAAVLSAVHRVCDTRRPQVSGILRIDDQENDRSLQGGCTETARNSTRLPAKSGYRGLRRGSRRCNTCSVRKRPYGVWVLVSLWPSHHETPVHDDTPSKTPYLYLCVCVLPYMAS